MGFVKGFRYTVKSLDKALNSVLFKLNRLNSIPKQDISDYCTNGLPLRYIEFDNRLSKVTRDVTIKLTCGSVSGEYEYRTVNYDLARNKYVYTSGIKKMSGFTRDIKEYNITWTFLKVKTK